MRRMRYRCATADEMYSNFLKSIFCVSRHMVDCRLTSYTGRNSFTGQSKRLTVPSTVPQNFFYVLERHTIYI